jgi:hypothetical protein
MPVNKTEAKRLEPAKLQKANDGLTALGQISDYNPQRKEYGGDKIKGLTDVLKLTGEAEIAAKNNLDKARDAASKAEWAVYDFMHGAAEQVQGQYGSDSDEYASIGYKKKSQYKKPAARKRPGDTTRHDYGIAVVYQGKQFISEKEISCTGISNHSSVK